MNRLPLRALALLSLVLMSCGDSQGTALRTAFLKGQGEDSILPMYRDLDARTASLATALATLADTPSTDTLGAVQDAWRSVCETWALQEALHIGPSEDLHTGAAVAQPASTTGIDTLLAGTDPLTPEDVALLGTNRKGLMAMEYLLFDADGGNTAVLARITQEGTPGARRRTFLASLGVVLHSDVTTVRAAWEPDQGNFLAQLSGAGTTSTRYPTQKDAVQEVFNQLLAAVEKEELRLSKPLGFDTGGTVQPDQEEARRSDNSLANLGNALTGMEQVWNGANGDGGMSRVVAASNKTLDATVRDNLAAVRTALQAIPPPLRTALYNHRDEVDAARAAFSTLRSTLASEVASNLGVSITFNDTDGD